MTLLLYCRYDILATAWYFFPINFNGLHFSLYSAIMLYTLLQNAVTSMLLSLLFRTWNRNADVHTTENRRRRVLDLYLNSPETGVSFFLFSIRFRYYFLADFSCDFVETSIGLFCIKYSILSSFNFLCPPSIFSFKTCAFSPLRSQNTINIQLL